MKIIQTFWSAPSESKEGKIEFGGRLSGGWLSERYHAISWTLSCLKFKQFYPEIELYTDSKGSDWLINTLDLPYTNVHNELDTLNDYNPMLWALPKLYVYGKQISPFLHADGDVFIWKKFDKALEESNLFVQNFESNHFYYKIIIEQIEKKFSFIPDCFKDLLRPGNSIRSINAGIIGGLNTEFFGEYVNLAFEFIKRNKKHLLDIDMGMFNTVFEQLLFFRLAQSKNLHVETAFEDSDSTFEQFLSVNTVPLLNHYIHTIGLSKQNPLVCLELEARLKYEFPKQYRHIADLYKEQKVFELSFVSKERFPIKVENTLENTRILLEQVRPEYDLHHNEINSLIEQFLEQESLLTEKQKLLIDIFQLENTYAQLSLNTWPNKLACDNLLNEIYKDLQILYNEERNAILEKKFTLTKNFKIIFIRHNFESELTTQYLKSIAMGQTTVKEGKGKLLLMENRYGEMLYSYLTEWDQLLYYFEDNTLSGHQLIELIESGETPFTSSGEQLEINVFNFLISQCFLFRRLKMSQKLENLHHSDKQ